METVTQLTENFNPDPDITVLDIRPVEGRGSLRAFVNIQLGKLIVNDCRVIQEQGKRPWFSLPVLTYRSELGTTLYKNIIQVVDEDFKKTISQVVLAAWEQKQEEGRNGTSK